MSWQYKLKSINKDHLCFCSDDVTLLKLLVVKYAGDADHHGAETKIIRTSMSKVHSALKQFVPNDENPYFASLLMHSYTRTLKYEMVKTIN